MRDSYTVKLAGLERRSLLFEVAPGRRMAVLNIRGDDSLVKACADALVEHMRELNGDVLVTAEAKRTPLAHALAMRFGRGYVVLRKTYKAYMARVMSVVTNSITTGDQQYLHLDEKDAPALAGRARCRAG